MGNLVPGATYIYERAGGVTYARIQGQDPRTRVPIGWELGEINTPEVFGVPTEQLKELASIVEKAKTNPALHQALEHVIMLHRLSKEYGQTEHSK